MELITVELDPETAALVNTTSWPGWAHLIVGDAVAVTERSGTFDLIFADAQGGKWHRLDLTINALRTGGTLLVDDMRPEHFPRRNHANNTERVREHLLNHP